MRPIFFSITVGVFYLIIGVLSYNWLWERHEPLAVTSLAICIAGALISGLRAGWSMLHMNPTDSGKSAESSQVPEIARAAFEAAQAEWPELLAKHQGKFVLYYGGQRLGIGRHGAELFDEFQDKGYPPDEMELFDIGPDAPTLEAEELGEWEGYGRFGQM